MEKLNRLLNINPNYFIIGLQVIFSLLSRSQIHLLNSIRVLNILFRVFCFSFFTANIFFANLQVFCIDWLNKHPIGLFYSFQIPFWIKLMMGGSVSQRLAVLSAC